VVSGWTEAGIGSSVQQHQRTGSDLAVTAIPEPADLADAARVLYGIVRETPLLSSPALDKALGARVLVKAECLQVTGSFKMRGAYYRLTRLGAQERSRGVVAFSSGNFAQGLACAGRLLNIPVTIVMPDDAPTPKIDATRDYGADIVLSHHGDRQREVVASDRARHIASSTGATLLHPFDDPWIVAGQSTATLEMLDQAWEIGVDLDAVLVPVGGGGLLAGCALACELGSGRERGSPDRIPRVIAVEPAGYDDFSRSLQSGGRVSNTAAPKTLCDALQAATPGAVTFAVAKGRVERGVAVGDAVIRNAMALAFRHLKIVLEPSGAVALAAVADPDLNLAGKTVGVLASGGNIAFSDFAPMLTAN
jgi:threonine dehydratase